MSRRLQIVVAILSGLLSLLFVSGCSYDSTDYTQNGEVYTPNASSTGSTDKTSEEPDSTEETPADDVTPNPTAERPDQETEAQEAQRASTFLITAYCTEDNPDVRVVEWLNGETGQLVKRRFFDVGSLLTLSSCNGNHIGSQERTAFSADFSQLVAVKVKGDRQYVGTVSGARTVSGSEFTALSHGSQVNWPGSFDGNGNVRYKNYSASQNSYQICRVNTSGASRSCVTASQQNATDNYVYFPSNRQVAKTPSAPADITSGDAQFSVRWSGGSWLYGSPENVDQYRGKTAHIKDGNTPYPFHIMDRTRVLAFDDDGIYDVHINRSRLKINHFFKGSDYSIADPVLSPRGHVIAFRGVIGSKSSLFLLESKNLKHPYMVNSMNSQQNARILAWIPNNSK